MKGGNKLKIFYMEKKKKETDHEGERGKKGRKHGREGRQK